MLRIRLERNRRGLSQDMLGRLTGVPRSDISRMETGLLRPTQWQAERLAAVLRVKPHELLEPARVEVCR